MSVCMGVGVCMEHGTVSGYTCGYVYAHECM